MIANTKLTRQEQVAECVNLCKDMAAPHPSAWLALSGLSVAAFIESLLRTMALAVELVPIQAVNCLMQSVVLHLSKDAAPSRVVSMSATCEHILRFARSVSSGIKPDVVTFNIRIRA